MGRWCIPVDACPRQWKQGRRKMQSCQNEILKNLRSGPQPLTPRGRGGTGCMVCNSCRHALVDKNSAVAVVPGEDLAGEAEVVFVTKAEIELAGESQVAALLHPVNVKVAGS